MSAKKKKMLRLLVLCSSLLWKTAPLLAAEGSPSAGLGEVAVTPITLRLSEQTVVSAKGVRSYSEGTLGIVDVRLTRNGEQLVLVGQQAGVTSLLLIMLDGSEQHFRIEVIDPEALVDERQDRKVERRENIRLDFYFVQLNRSHDLDIGIRYPRSITMGNLQMTFDFLTKRFESATAMVANQALLQLDMAEASGWARIKRQAAVITENGQRAVFFGGGEVNVAVQGSLTTGIHTIDFGSTIDVLPRYDTQSGRLQIELNADVADLTDDRGTGAPGRVRSTLKTVVNLELGQAVVLAGLTSESSLVTRSGVPGLSQIPILGLLFGGKKKAQQRADSVVFIVPTVVEAPSLEIKEKIDDALHLFRKYSGARKDLDSLKDAWGKP